MGESMPAPRVARASGCPTLDWAGPLRICELAPMPPETGMEKPLPIALLLPGRLFWPLPRSGKLPGTRGVSNPVPALKLFSVGFGRCEENTDGLEGGGLAVFIASRICLGPGVTGGGTMPARLASGDTLLLAGGEKELPADLTVGRSPDC
jgi:hypothetical protein